jgi:hypothetical protein
MQVKSPPIVNEPVFVVIIVYAGSMPTMPGHENNYISLESLENFLSIPYHAPHTTQLDQMYPATLDILYPPG